MTHNDPNLQNASKEEIQNFRRQTGQAGLVPFAVLGGAILGEGALTIAPWLYTNPTLIETGAAIVWGVGTDEDMPGSGVDAAVRLTRNSASKLSDYDIVMKEMGESIVTVFHKGKLNEGKVLANKALSVGTDFYGVNALSREGKVYQFDIPTDIYKRWDAEGLIQTRIDLNDVTGQINSEIRFDKTISNELNKYIKE